MWDFVRHLTVIDCVLCRNGLTCYDARVELDERLTRIEDRLDVLEGRHGERDRRALAVERVAEVLEECTPGVLNLRQLLVAVAVKGPGFRSELVRAAIDELVAAGRVTEALGPRRARLFRSVK